MTKMTRCFTSRRSLLLHSQCALALVVCCILKTCAQHVYTDSFPTNDEYDFAILDPHHVYGSPYGGYGRATRSRLAALPLHLPGVTWESTSMDEERYFQVRDGQGRLFACRVYHEDELDPSSLEDSMFNAAKSRKETNVVTDEGQGNVETLTTDAAPKTSDTASTNPTPVVQEYTKKVFDDSPSSNHVNEVLAEAVGKLYSVVEIDQILSKLRDICTQIHMGWWSYEWCHQQRVSQFHIHLEKDKDLRLESVTSLGKFTTRNIIVDGAEDNGFESNDPDNDLSASDKMKLKAAQPKELGVVTDEFENGDICPDNQLPRRTTVELRCCSLDVMKRFKSAVVHKGQPVPSNIAAITSVKEDKEKVCTYHIEVCTPLLCEGLADAYQNGLVAEEIVKKPATQPVVARRDSVRPKLKEGASIREILDATIKNACLRHVNGGWWVYEVCHGRHVRQYHEGDKIDLATGSYSRVPESIYMLGLYSEDDLEGYPNEDEPLYVTNPAGDHGPQVGTPKTNSARKEGTGAYFVQEYTGGDVCDDTDVTNRAIKAGNVGEGGIERASTVRYFCGQYLEMVRVVEDSTCHYVVDITIPELCEHALFKVPVSKKEVVKCLPVDSIASMT